MSKQKRTRRRFTAEFKAETVKLVQQSNRTMACRKTEPAPTWRMGREFYDPWRTNTGGGEVRSPGGRG